MTERQRLRAVIRGAVQGVGFRPYVYRLATQMGLPGWVKNSPQGVFLEIEGTHDLLETFLLRLEDERPPRASIQSLEYSLLPLAGFTEFEIRASDTAGDSDRLWCCPISRRARIACANFSIRTIDGMGIRSRTARTAVRGSRLSVHCRTIVPRRPWPAS